MRPTTLGREVSRKTRDLARLSERFEPSFRRRLDVLGRRLEMQARVLESLSYEGVLKRGFAIVEGPGGRLLRSVGSIAPGDALRLRLADGEIGAIAGDSVSSEQAKAGQPHVVTETAPKSRKRSRKIAREDDQGNLF